MCVSVPKPAEKEADCRDFSPAGPAVPLSVIDASTHTLSQSHSHSEVIFKPIKPLNEVPQPMNKQDPCHFLCRLTNGHA